MYACGCRIRRKPNGVAAKLAHAGRLLMEHRHALIVYMGADPASGYAERDGRSRCWTVCHRGNGDVPSLVKFAIQHGITPAG